MKRDIAELNKDELLKAMIFNGSVEKVPSIEKMYKSMDLIDLRIRAYMLYGDTIHMPDPPVRMQRYAPPPKPEKMVIPKVVYIKPKLSDLQWDLQSDLLNRRWIDDVTEIAYGHLNVKCESKYQKRVLAIANKIGYKGEVHFNG